MKKYNIGAMQCALFLLLFWFLVFFCICSKCRAGDYKSCVIKYKTDADLCRGIADSLNVVDTVSYIDTCMFTMKECSVEGEKRIIEMFKSRGEYVASERTGKGLLYWTLCEKKYIKYRQYRGLAFESVPEWRVDLVYDFPDTICLSSINGISTIPYKPESTLVKYGKVILIWEEVEK